MLEAACCLEERLPHLHNTDSAGMISQPSRHWGKRLKCPEHAECSADGLATTSAEGGKIAEVIRVKGSSEQKHTGQSEGEADEAEMALVARLAKAEENIRVLHSALTATQRELLDLRCKYKEEMASKAAEIGVRMSDLEKANRRAETAQREVERLTEQLAVCSSAEGTTTERRETGLGSSYMSTALLAKDKEIARLQEDVQSLQRTLQDTQEHSANQIAEMERQLTEKAETIERLEAKLRSQQDYEKIKTELSILKSLRIVSDNGNCLQESLKAAQTTDKEVVLSSLKDTVEKRGVSHNCDESLSEEECPRESARPVESHASPQGILRLDECPSASPDLLPQRSYGLHPFPAERHLFSPPYKKDGPALLAFSINPHPTSMAGQSLAGSRAEDGEMEPHTDQSEGGGGTEEEPLETLEIAQQVKEQLLKHNIGQRVFGHYVLGLSQGSVSEILARPKPWSKLTVKGKEPFVKMKQFLSDEQNILALRTIQVRQRGSITPRIRTPETGSDDAIKNILEQAKKEIQSQRGNDGKASPGSSAASSSTRTSNGGGSSSDDNIKNILERARLEMQAQRHQQAMQEMEACGWAAPRPPSSLPITIKREGPVCPQAPLSILSPAAFVQSIIRKVKSEIGDAGTYFDQHWASEREGAGLQPSSPASPSFSSSSSSSSSLGHQPEKDRDGSGEEAAEDESGPQPMKTEAVELLVSGDSLGSGGMAYYTAYVPRALKPTVPPLTPEQYETYMYREVDTIELTRLVKEKLAKSGICQRIFGEKVLGLSQGSVSDMLSRPKPWGKLTQKGREPFIRMQLWLQDPVGQGLSQSANQSLCPDTSPVPMATHSPPSPLPSPKEDGPKLEVEPILLSREGSKENQHPCDPPPLQEPPASKGPAPSRPPPGHTVLGIQELVGLSPELDTQLVTKRVKEVLTNNNLGQRLFGESVLGLTQGSVSDLLSRPKPWHKLSLKGREPFVRMQLWLSDPHNVEKLRDTKKMEKKVCTKRRYGSLAPGSDSDSHSSRSDSVSPVMTSRDPYGLAKKPRVVLASREKEALIKAYVLEPYPSQQTVEMLASQLGLKTNTVINWFHNYRSRMRREVQQEAGQENDVEVEPPGFSPSAQSSIPNQQGAPWGLHYICPPGSPGCFVSVKMEDEEQNILAQKESSDRGKPSHIDEGVQIPCLVKKEFEDPEAWCIERSSGRCCPKSPQEDRVPLGQSLGGFLDPQRAAPLQREAEDSSKASVDPVSFKASSEPSRGSLEVPLNSPSAASSPGMVVSISPIPSSSDPISPTPPNPSHNSDPPPNLRLDKNTQRLKEKVANLNSIIHRLERAANKEDTLEWEF